jgi:hypothetical protein
MKWGAYLKEAYRSAMPKVLYDVKGHQNVGKG